MTGKVSIIIPCFNDADFIEQSVQSAIDQTYQNKEIIVIDDGSDQKTKEVLKNIEPKIDKLIIQENLGVVIARNNGIEAAKGEFILTLDSDDYFEPGFLEKSVKIMKEDHSIGMVTCWMSIKNEKDEVIRVDKPTGSPAFTAMFHNNAPATLLYRKVCWEEVGGYDNNLLKGYEDWDFNIAVCKNGWKIHVIPEVLFNYRKTFFSRNKAAKNFYAEIRKYTYKKHKDLLVQNIDQSIDLLLNEIETKNKEITKLRNLKVYKFEKFFMKAFRKLKSYF